MGGTFQGDAMVANSIMQILYDMEKRLQEIELKRLQELETAKYCTIGPVRILLC
jgi:hypothetical protein